MPDFNRMWSTLQGAVNQTGRAMPSLGVLGILGKPIVEAGLAGLGWGAGATKAAASGNMIDPGPSLYHALNIYGLGGPAGGLTSGGMKAAPWFSALGRAVEAAPLKQAPGQQWLGTIKNVPGVKQEELDWMGVPEWLASQPGPVTKQQLSDYIAQNKVDVQEVVKGIEPTPKEWQAALARNNGNVNAARREAPATETKFSQYQLPGGENYRELLLTMPGKKFQEGWKVVKRGGKFHLQKPDGSLHTAPGDPNPASWSNAAAAQSAYNFNAKNPNQFTGGHYDEPNVLAHVRFNDRVTADGKKTLFLEEIQSDWHQKGRKQGYKAKPEEQAAMQRRLHQINMEKDVLAGDRDPVTNVMRDEKRWHELSREQEQLMDRYNNTVNDAIPDAPFKSSWPELSLKRMIKWAADNGYDSVSWTPGKVQAERYDLSKQVNRVEYHPESKALQAFGKDDELAISKTLKGDNELADHIGKEAAEKILKAPKDSGWHFIEGDDLKVGGEGMKAFYDKMLVNAANKLGKKYGAKVGVTKVQTEHFNKKSLRDAMRDGDATYQMSTPGEQEVWSLPITDAMRKEVGEKGLPLFSGGKGGSLAAILNQALTGDNGESLGDILSRSLKK